MPDEMLQLARANAFAAGLENVEFLNGYLEDMPLADATVEVVISNCVINLSSTKPTASMKQLACGATAAGSKSQT
jgi:arsenite methyltransferase